MGTFQHLVRLAAADGRRFRDLQPWVDTGAHLSQFPASLLAELGYEPKETTRFQNADGNFVELPIGEVQIRIGDQAWTVPATFGEEDAPMLLGATALEIFRLQPDPVFKILRPVVAMRLTRLIVPDREV
jgi:predicted aspartyl protease